MGKPQALEKRRKGRENSTQLLQGEFLEEPRKGLDQDTLGLPEPWDSREMQEGIN